MKVAGPGTARQPFPSKLRGAALAALVSVVAAAPGCVPVVGALGGGAAAVVGAQERSAGAALDDATVNIRVQGRLLREDPGLFAKVGVEVVEGRVLLTGVVNQEEAKKKAGQITWETQGVKEVLNELQVRPKGRLLDAVRDAGVDAGITARLRYQLAVNENIYDINYDIETVNGTVYLLGIARSDQELTAVTEIARNISGVTAVVSHVRIKGEPVPAAN